VSIPSSPLRPRLPVFRLQYTIANFIHTVLKPMQFICSLLSIDVSQRNVSPTPSSTATPTHARLSHRQSTPAPSNRYEERNDSQHNIDSINYNSRLRRSNPSTRTNTTNSTYNNTRGSSRQMLGQAYPPGSREGSVSSRKPLSFADQKVHRWLDHNSERLAQQRNAAHYDSGFASFR